MEKNFEVTKKNGMRIVGKMFVPDSVGEDFSSDIKFPTVVFSHGFNSCFKELEHHAKGYVDEGIVCVMFDFCGGGAKTLSDGTLIDMTPITEAEDLQTVMEYALSFDFVDENNFFLLGESQGGFESAYVAAAVPEKIKGLILWYPAFVIPFDAKERFERDDNTCFGMDLCPHYNTDAKDIDNDELMKKYDGPVLLIHGDKDSIVPISYSIDASEKYSNARLIVMKDADHGYEGEDSVNARNFSIEFILSEKN